MTNIIQTVFECCQEPKIGRFGKTATRLQRWIGQPLDTAWPIASFQGRQPGQIVRIQSHHNRLAGRQLCQRLSDKVFGSFDVPFQQFAGQLLSDGQGQLNGCMLQLLDCVGTPHLQFRNFVPDILQQTVQFL